MGSTRILALLGMLYGIADLALCKNNDVMAKTLPAYTVALEAESLNSSSCREELLMFKEAVDQRTLWALRVLDSSGEPKSGFTIGNNFWLGNRAQCYETYNKNPLQLSSFFLQNNSRFRNPEEETAPFGIRYFVAYASHNSTVQYHIRIPNEEIIILGLCLPASCSTNDISVILNRIFYNRTLLFGDLYSMDLKILEVKDLQDDHQWLLNGKVIFIAIVVLTLLLLMIGGTVYDVMVHQKYLRMKEKYLKYENNNTTSEAKCNMNISEEDAVQLTPRSLTLYEEILMCFSIYTNTIKIFDTELGEKSINCIHGMRFLGMFWIILAHAVLFSLNYFDNKVWLIRVDEQFLSQLINKATYVVDTFLFLSGFLAAYMYWDANTHKEDSKKRFNCNRSFKNVALMLLKRYMRLTPTYMLFYGLYEVNAFWYTKTSIFSMIYNQHEVCAKYWWRNMFYMNNLFRSDDMCMLWSWYLAVDMQFFILTIVLLTLSTVYFKTAAVILGSLFFGSILWTGYLSQALNFVATLDDQNYFLDALYDPPWVRFGPYAIGIAFAYILINYGKDIHLSKRVLFIGWIIGCFCNLSVIWGLWLTELTVMSSAIYTALSRSAWGLFVAWVVFVCHTNNAPSVNRILSFKGFIPLSRLTYCAYLVNPFILQSVYLSSETAAHLQVLNSGLVGYGLILSSYLSAYLLCLTIEMPTAHLINLVVKPRHARK